MDERTKAGRLDDAALAPWVEKAEAGDADAFERIVRIMQGPVRSFARRMMRDAALGDDAAQETFVRMWRGLDSYRESGRFVSWTFTIARNTCIELLRKEARTPEPTEELPLTTDDPMDRALVRREVIRAINSLDEPYRSTFLLRETGLTYEEVADACGCPVGTVRSRLHAARRELADKLAPLVGGGEQR